MKTSKFLHFLTIVFYLGISNCLAQQSPTSSGGDLTGTTGSISYSVGQIDYKTNNGSNGYVIEGVQQPYEISEVLAIENFSELITDVTIYPNPSTDVLMLKLINKEALDLNFKLMDVNGRLIKTDKISSEVTEISVLDLPSSIYFLQILNQNKEVKNYKIIKH
ncbi:T9SS type A sorting domain-containing protein [Flavobacterium sp. U410]